METLLAAKKMDIPMKKILKAFGQSVHFLEDSLSSLYVSKDSFFDTKDLTGPDTAPDIKSIIQNKKAPIG
jgi:hypothetical protein